MGNKKSVSVVIPNWNGRLLMEKNLPFVIAASKHKKNNISEIIIVDDKSGDDSVSYLEKNYADEIRLIKHKENRGFSTTVNMGVRMAKGELICLINTDVVPTAQFLENTITHFERPEVFAVGLHERGEGVPKVSLKAGYLDFKRGKETEKVTESLWASGGSAVFDRKKWLELKGLDESLYSPFYWEDIDLGYRAWKRGYVILWEPKAIVEHKHESIINESNFSRKRINTIKERNELIFNCKNLTSQSLIRKHIRGVLARTARHPGYLRIIFKVIPRIPLILSSRKTEKKEAKVADEAIIARFS